MHGRAGPAQWVPTQSIIHRNQCALLQEPDAAKGMSGASRCAREGRLFEIGAESGAGAWGAGPWPPGEGRQVRCGLCQAAGHRATTCPLAALVLERPEPALAAGPARPPAHPPAPRPAPLPAPAWLARTTPELQRLLAALRGVGDAAAAASPAMQVGDLVFLSYPALPPSGELLGITVTLLPHMPYFSSASCRVHCHVHPGVPTLASAACRQSTLQCTSFLPGTVFKPAASVRLHVMDRLGFGG